MIFARFGVVNAQREVLVLIFHRRGQEIIFGLPLIQVHSTADSGMFRRIDHHCALLSKLVVFLFLRSFRINL